jgi:uncharacterized OB-fold protein
MNQPEDERTSRDDAFLADLYARAEEEIVPAHPDYDSDEGLERFLTQIGNSQSAVSSSWPIPGSLAAPSGRLHADVRGRDRHDSEHMVDLRCPACGVKVQPEDLFCFRCGASLPHALDSDDDDYVLTPTISQRYIAAGSDPAASCPNCGSAVSAAADVICPVCGGPMPTGRRRRMSYVVMRITFPTGTVEIPAGTSLILGSDPAESLVAAAFARFDNVSRRHATIQVNDAGHASIRDEGSANGTYVNDDRVPPRTEVRLVDGDRVRLAADVTGNVSLPQAETDPALERQPKG